MTLQIVAKSSHENMFNARGTRYFRGHAYVQEHDEDLRILTSA